MKTAFKTLSVIIMLGMIIHPLAKKTIHLYLPPRLLLLKPALPLYQTQLTLQNLSLLLQQI